MLPQLLEARPPLAALKRCTHDPGLGDGVVVRLRLARRGEIDTDRKRKGLAEQALTIARPTESCGQKAEDSRARRVGLGRLVRLVRRRERGRTPSADGGIKGEDEMLGHGSRPRSADLKSL